MKILLELLFMVLNLWELGLVVNFLRVFLGLVREKFGGCAYFEFAMD